MAEVRAPLLAQEEEDSGDDRAGMSNIPESRELQQKRTNILDKGRPALSTFKRILKDSKPVDIRLLIIGKTGQGKSTLINSIIELEKEIAAEGAGANHCTAMSESYYYCNVVPGVNVTLIDTPGLRDIQGKEERYIKQMKEECPEVSLVLFCKNIKDRLTIDDKVAIQKLHQAFGHRFWERVVIVFTFANKEDCEERDERDEDNPEQQPPFDDDNEWNKLLKKRFVHRVELYAEAMRNILNFEHAPKVIPVGTSKKSRKCLTPLCLPDRENWLHDLLQVCYDQIKTKHNLSTLRLNNLIHLAVIIDNREEFKADKATNLELSDEAAALKQAFEGVGFCVLYFKSLSSQSIATLLQSFQDDVDHYLLSIFALVFLSKGKKRQLYDANNKVVPYQNVLFTPNSTDLETDARKPLLPDVPKLFFFDLASCSSIQEEVAIKLPNNSLLLHVTHKDLFSHAIDSFAENLNYTDLTDCLAKVCQQNNKSDGVKCFFWGSKGHFIANSLNKKSAFLKRQLHIFRSMLHSIKRVTIDVIAKNKDEVMKIVHMARAVRIATSVIGIVIGGGFVVTGLVLAPFTFGGSIGLSVAGGAIGILSSSGGIGAFIASKVMSNSRLKAAQEHISLDQQLSLQVNAIVLQYMKMESTNDGSVTGINYAAHIAANIGRFSSAAVIAGEGTVEGVAIALRAGGRVAGMVLSGVSLAVTVPIDVGFIAYHSYEIHKSSKDKTGKTESDVTVQWLIQQIENLLKGTCSNVDEQSVRPFEKPECGYKASLPVPITITTIFSGPFDLPRGYTLVSAVYDVRMDSEQEQPITIEVEHCVNVSSKSIAENMCFATATVDLERKKLNFTKVKDGVFHVDATSESITREGSFLFCVLYKEVLQETPLKYAAFCSCTKKYKNFYIMEIIFMKHLKVHFKYAESRFSSDVKCIPFTFKGQNYLSIQLEEMEMPEGWSISPALAQDNIIIKRTDIDNIELRSKTVWNQQNEIFPSIGFLVYVLGENAENLDMLMEFEGTDLKVPMKFQKE